MIARPLILAFLLGTSLSIAATGTVNLALVASTTVAWGGVVIIQLLAALAVITGARQRRLPLADAVAEFFGLHTPWSLWLLAYAAWCWMTPLAGRQTAWLLWTALVPAAWSAVLIYRFCRIVLADPAREALRRTLVHQAIIWLSFLLIGGAAVGLWPRLLRGVVIG